MDSAHGISPFAFIAKHIFENILIGGYSREICPLEFEVRFATGAVAQVQGRNRK
jgi:hypothetical protein